MNKKYLYKFKFTIFFLIVIIDISMAQVNTIPGLKLWLKSDSGIVLNGLKVSSWTDKSGNSHNTFQLDTNLQPRLISNILNNFPALRFNGTSILKGDVIPTISSSSISIFIVASGASMNNQYNVLFDIGPYAPGGMWLSKYNNNFTIYSNNNIYSSTSGQLNSSGFSPTIFSYIKKLNVISESYINMLSVANSSNASFTGNFANGSFIVGGDTTYSGKWNGDIFEIIVFDQSLLPFEVDIVYNYLNNKYAPPIQLPNDIIISDSLCNIIIEPTIINNNQYSNFQWSNGATTSTISVNKSGKYWVKATNIFGKESSDTINISFPGYFPENLNLCSNESKDWDTQLPKSKFSFVWNDNSSDSLITISSPGTYSVTISDGFGCSISHSINVTQDNFPSTTSLGPDISLCAGNSISLQQGLQPNLTYTWNTNENTSAITVTNTGQYSVIITNTNNCVAKDTINVTILGQAPTAAFTNTNACKNNALTFTDNSSPPLGNSLANWYWNFGDVNTLADTSHLQNPFYTYADTGNYIITLNVETNVGCKQSITKTIHVAPTPSVNFNNSITCQNDTTVFTNISSSPNYNPITYQWNFGDLSSGINNNSSSINPKHLFSTQGNFPVKLIATNNVGCKDSLTKTINVKSQVKASFIYSPACKGTPTLFQDNSIVPAPNNQNIRLWSFGTTTLSGTSVSRTFTNTGVYPVTLTVNGLNGCNSSTSKLITVFLPPTASFTVPNICLKDTVTITNLSNAQSGIISNYNWKLNQLPFSSVQSPTLSPTSSANYTMQLAVTNSFGCKDSITKTITVLPLPNVDFTSDPPTFYFTNSAITFSPTINNGSFYQWNIDGAIYTTPTITLTFNSIGSHTNILFMTDQQGCSNTKTKTFTISDYLLDLAILDIRTQKDNNNFITVEADLANFGTAPVYSFEITYDVTDAASNKENWSGTLNPSSFKTYTFTSKTLYKKQNDSYITCVTINKVNSIQDDNTNNNQLCVNSDLNSIAVGNPYPNPTNTDVKIPVTLTRDTDITIELYDALGQVIYTEYTIKGGQGLNLISIPTTNLNQSVYTLKVLVGDKIFTKKILKSVQ